MLNVQPPVSRIDSHQHFWKFDPVRDSWINEDMKIIQRDFLPTDLAPILAENKIDGCVSVQADPSEKETQFLLDIASSHDFVKGVVGWVDLQSPRLKERLDYYSSFKKLKGFRHIAQAEPVGFLRRPIFSNGIRLLREYHFTYDLLIYPQHLEDAIWLVQHHPDQKFVIDHLAKPVIREKEFLLWSAGMKTLSAFENVSCKLSGMVTEAHWQNWTLEDFKPYLEFVLQHFGTSRVMYGSDWPVCLVAASYQNQLYIVEDFLHSFSASEKHQIMGDNAIQFYNL